MAECGGLENRCLARGREFESHPLRHFIYRTVVTAIIYPKNSVIPSEN